MTETATPMRRIRSYVRRGRLTDAQQRSLESLWPRFGVSAEQAAADPGFWDRAFDVSGPLTLEIGFGMGQSLLTMAEAEPQRRFIGVEVHEPGVGALLNGLHRNGVNNVRVMAEDVMAIFEHVFAPGQLDRVQIFFPDPWPKKKHHKRRMVQPDFVARLASRVKPGGELMLATDWEPYAEWMLDVLDAAPDWRNAAGPGQCVPRPAARPETRFEARGMRRGHRVCDLLYTRI